MLAAGNQAPVDGSGLPVDIDPNRSVWGDDPIDRDVVRLAHEDLVDVLLVVDDVHDLRLCCGEADLGEHGPLQVEVPVALSEAHTIAAHRGSAGHEKLQRCANLQIPQSARPTIGVEAVERGGVGDLRVGDVLRIQLHETATDAVGRDQHGLARSQCLAP